VSIDVIRPMDLTLSPPVAAALPGVKHAVRAALWAIGAHGVAGHA